MLWKKAEADFKKTLFLSTSFDDISAMARLGWVKNAVVVKGTKAEKEAHNLYFLENDASACYDSISDLPQFAKAKDYISKALSSSENIWTFRPYRWTDDFGLRGLDVLTNDYFGYLSLSNKLRQDHILIKHGGVYLKEHLFEKHKKLQRDYLLTETVDADVESGFLFFSSESTSCAGLRTSPTDQQWEENLFIRKERLVEDSIPLCQNAVILEESIIKYPPKISFVKRSGENLGYFGGDFKALPTWIEDSEVQRITFLTHQVCETLRKIGFKGIVNVDYVLDKKSRSLYFVEVNPRYSACTFVLDDFFANHWAELGEMRDLMPSVLHISAFKQYPLLSKLHAEFDSPNKCVEIDFDESDTTGFLKLFSASDEPLSLQERHEVYRVNTPSVSGKEYLTATIRLNREAIASPTFPVRLIDDLEAYFLP